MDPTEIQMLDKRREIVRRIHEGLPKSKIISQVDVSKPTVDRAFRELDQAEIIDRRGSKYIITRYGELIIGNYLRTLSFTNKMNKLKPLLLNIDKSINLSEEDIQNAKMTISNPKAPYENMKEIIDWIKKDTNIEIYLPVATPYLLENILDIDGDREIEVIIKKGIRDKIQKGHERLRELLQDSTNISLRYRDYTGDIGIVFLKNKNHAIILIFKDKTALLQGTLYIKDNGDVRVADLRPRLEEKNPSELNDENTS